MHSQDPTIILGGGFTGLFTALHLSRQAYPYPIVLIDRAERFVFKPLLYDLLSGEMTAKQVWPRYAELLQQRGIQFVQDTVQTIDLVQRRVQLASGTTYPYRHLVLALGSVPGYFGVPGAKEHTRSFRTGQDVVALQDHLRDRCRQAIHTQDPQDRRSLLTVGIVGAGPSGVELAATLADLLPDWYSQLGGNPQEIYIVLLNRGTDILEGDINDHLRDIAQTALQQRQVPVQVLNEAEVTAVHPQHIEFERHGATHTLSAATLVWTAGTTTHPLIRKLPIAETHRDRRGRVKVTPTLQLPDFPEVFAGGDCAAENPESLPPTAQVAHQQGAAIAHNLQAIALGNDLKPVNVTLQGSLMKLGLGESAANLFNRFEITGKLGHLIRQATYLKLLPTPERNLQVTAQWLRSEIWQPFFNKPPQLLPGLGQAAVSLVLVAGVLLAWRDLHPEQFRQVWHPTGIPDLLEQVLPDDRS